MTCTRCHTAHYCQKSCQAADWKKKDGRSHRDVFDKPRDFDAAGARKPGKIENQDSRLVEEDALDLLDACYVGNVIEVFNLLGSGVDLNYACKKHMPPLYGICGKEVCGKSEFISALLSNGADPNSADVAGQTALHRACQHGHISAAKALILSDVDVCAADDKGWYFI
jgi:hypothetical protein